MQTWSAGLVHEPARWCATESTCRLWDYEPSVSILLDILPDVSCDLIGLSLLSWLDGRLYGPLSYERSYSCRRSLILKKIHWRLPGQNVKTEPKMIEHVEHRTSEHWNIYSVKQKLRIIRHSINSYFPDRKKPQQLTSWWNIQYHKKVEPLQTRDPASRHRLWDYASKHNTR